MEEGIELDKDLLDFLIFPSLAVRQLLSDQEEHSLHLLTEVRHHHNTWGVSGVRSKDTPGKD